MFTSILHLLWNSPQAYLILFALAAGDAVLPALPSESAVILAGLLCVVGPHLSLPWVIASAALGALVGDNTSYAIAWALYGALLGYFGGRTFHDKPWLALIVAFGIAFGITAGVEGWRRFRERA